MPDTIGATSGSSVSIRTVPVTDHIHTEYDLFEKEDSYLILKTHVR